MSAGDKQNTKEAICSESAHKRNVTDISAKTKSSVPFWTNGILVIGSKLTFRKVTRLVVLKKIKLPYLEKVHKADVYFARCIC